MGVFDIVNNIFFEEPLHVFRMPKLTSLYICMDNIGIFLKRLRIHAESAEKNIHTVELTETELAHQTRAVAARGIS